MSIFKDLLAIKSFREGQAEAAVRTQRHVLKEAGERHEAAAALLTRMREEGRMQELSMYQRLCENIVRLRDIENVQLEVAGLRTREDQQHQRVNDALDVRDKESVRLDVVREAHKEASRQKSKFVDLASMHATEALREAERKEDLEMEEAASVKRDREDWDEYAEGEQS